MYIRTQDRKMLIPIQNLIISINYKDTEEIIISSSNTITEDDDWYYSLGVYGSETRALEVLDDIQTTLEECYVSKITYSSALHNYKNGIYTMPEK